MDRQRLAVVLPPHMGIARRDQPVEILFPAGMRAVPKWARSLNTTAIRLPDFQGRSVDTVGCRLRRLEVGGEAVRRIRVDEGCRVDVPSDRHALPVKVEWIDEHRRVVRCGGPDNHFNRPAPDRIDLKLPRNCKVNFSTPWYTHHPIACRHIASHLDETWSVAGSDVEPAGLAAKAACPAAGAEASAGRHARYARQHLNSSERFQAAIPHDHDARYYDLIARSRDATVVANPAFTRWLSSRFDAMNVGEERTYLLITKMHVMNLALRVRPGDRGTPIFGAIFIDPNAYSRPVSVETADKASIERWSLERFIGSAGLAAYYPAGTDGKPHVTSLLVETPRGNVRRAFDAKGSRELKFEPRVSFFPAAAEPTGLDAAFGGLMSDPVHRDLPQRTGSFPPGELFDSLCHVALVSLRLSHGKAADITTAFDTLRRQVARGELTAMQAMTSVAPLFPSHPASNAVVEGRADALYRYRLGLEALLADGTFTSVHSQLFLSLFSAESRRVIDTLGRSGTAAQKEAAGRFKELLTTIAASVAAVEDPATRSA